MEGKKEKTKPDAAFRIGAIALVFLIIGYQTALFIHQTAITKIVSEFGATPVGVDTGAAPVALADSGASISSLSTSRTGGSDPPAREARVEEARKAVVKAYVPRRVESFRFNPNTASVDEFQRLGFSEKQAQSIVNYRNKGGKFRRKEDFAKSFVVSDSIYERLAPFIDIPLLDINRADSAAFDALPGIGPYFAAKMVEYRQKIGGYTSTEQLLDIWKFDQDRYDAIKDLITCGVDGE